MSITFGGYQVTFSAGVEPVYLQLCWPVKTDPAYIHVTRSQATFNHRDKLAGLDLIATEQSVRKGIVYEVYLYGKAGNYKAEPVVEWPEEI